MTFLLPALVCLAGLLLYALSAAPKPAELGRIAFAAGLLVLVWHAAGQTIHLP